MFKEPIFIGIKIIGERVVCREGILLIFIEFELCELGVNRFELLSLCVLKKILSEIVWGVEYLECDFIGRLLYRWYCELERNVWFGRSLYFRFL